MMLYELVKNGQSPTFENNLELSASVSVGDKVYHPHDKELFKVISIEHYPKVTVLNIE